MQIEMNLCALLCNSRRQCSRPRIRFFPVAETRSHSWRYHRLPPHLSLSEIMAMSTLLLPPPFILLFHHSLLYPR